MAQPQGTWWDQTRVRALLQDIVRAEWRRLRPQAKLDSAALDLQGPGFDSLERVQVASAIAAFFQMQRVGLEDNLLATTTLDQWVEIVCESLAVHDQQLGFRSSGSTGEPTLAVHDLDHLQQEVAFLAELLGPCEVIAGVVPRHHIYGFLFTVLLPQQLGARFIDARDRLPGQVAAALGPASAVVGYPDYWQLVAANNIRFGADVSGITSTAPCPDELARQLVPRQLGRLIQLYGASETAGIAWRDHPDAPFALFPYWQRADDAHLQRAGAAAPVPLPDYVSWTSERHFQVQDRRDQAVQIGGINVDPEQVAAALMRHPQVRKAAVRRMRPAEGERLKAFIVPADPDVDRQTLREALTRFVDQTLDVPARPRAFTFGDRLPTAALGKAADWSLDS